jgi:uncharacterized protein (DUF4415 family)
MSEERSRRIANDLARAIAMADEDINTDDIPEVFDWSDAVRGKFYRPIKEQVTLRIDADLLAWFRQNEDKYQTAINAALREHVDRQRQARRELAASKR